MSNPAPVSAGAKSVARCIFFVLPDSDLGADLMALTSDAAEGRGLRPLEISN